MAKEELSLRYVKFNWSWGIRKLKEEIKKHEETAILATNKHAFFPAFHDADQWLEPEELDLKEKVVRYGGLKTQHIEYARSELRERGVTRDAKFGIRKLKDLIKQHEDSLTTDETLRNSNGFFPQCKTPPEWKDVVDQRPLA